jgi:hypothetical protein
VWGKREGAEWLVREEVGAGGRNDPSLAWYAHVNNKRKKKSKLPNNL